MLVHGELTDRVIGLAINVHKHLGPGLLECVYEECLTFELAEAGFAFQRQLPIPIIYRNTLLTHLRLSKRKVGLLINFNVLRLKDGLRRFVV